MPALRAHRFLPLLLGLALLFGAAAPLVQAVCALAMAPEVSASHGMAGMDHEDDAPPCDAAPSDPDARCCVLDGTAPMPGTLIAEAAPRLLETLSAVLSPGISTPSAVLEAPTLPAPKRPPALPPPSARQALLATFLI